ncbi:hypothetical protein [Pseudomonas syringae]|uniref:hypothetical protein n=1 Tax=Pseudomonas syringae TaxID=317 RepID=UPI00046706FC|nr:hypothetical protein [Pseudomonas syringae]
MIWMMLFLGFFAVLPGYMVSVEERLLMDKRFHPLSVVANLNRSVKARKFLSYFGLFLLVCGCFCYLLFGQPITELLKGVHAVGDLVRLAGAVMIVWSFFFYGYAREEELGRLSENATHYSWAKDLKGQALFGVVSKACVASLFLLLGVAGLILIRLIIDQGWSTWL